LIAESRIPRRGFAQLDERIRRRAQDDRGVPLEGRDGRRQRRVVGGREGDQVDRAAAEAAAHGETVPGGERRDLLWGHARADRGQGVIADHLAAHAHAWRLAGARLKGFLDAHQRNRARSSDEADTLHRSIGGRRRIR